MCKKRIFKYTTEWHSLYDWIGFSIRLKCIQYTIDFKNAYGCGEILSFQWIIRNVFRVLGCIAMFITNLNGDVRHAAGDKCYRIGIITFVHFVVCFAVHRFVLLSVEKYRPICVALLYTCGCEWILPFTVFGFEFQSGQSAKRPRTFAVGYFCSKPCCPCTAF